MVPPNDQRPDLSQPHTAIDPDSVRKELQQHQQDNRSAIRSNAVQLGLSIMLLPLWIYLGDKTSSPWMWYLTLPVIFGGAVFNLVYQSRRRKTLVVQSNSLLDCARYSLADVESQIRLVSNYFRWYLLPLGILIAAFLARSSWLESKSVGLSVAFVALVFAAGYFIHWSGRRRVSSQLEPRRQELLTLIARLKSDEAIA